MPVLIVDSNGSTSTNDGTIKLDDLITMTSDFQNQVSLVALLPRNSVIKRNSFYITKAQLDALFTHYAGRPELDTIEIALGVQVPNSVTHCVNKPNPTDNSDCIGIIVSMTDQITREPVNAVNEYVLINGYHPFPTLEEIAMCCPGSKPPPPPIN